MKDNDIVITADTGCDLENFNDLSIPVSSISSYILDGSGKQYKDRLEITNKEIYERINKGELFKTSAPNIQDFEAFFVGLLEKYNKIIHISISSEISSGAYNNSFSVAQKLNETYGERIFVLDSRQASCGAKLVTFILAKMIEQSDEISNEGIKEIISIIRKDYIPKIETHFLITDATGFINSGRNKSDLKAKDFWKLGLVKTLKKLGIKFEITVKDGKFVQSGVKRYNKKNMFETFAKNKIETIGINNISDIGTIFGTTYSSNNSLCDETYKYLNNLKFFKYIQRQDMSSVVGAYGSEDSCYISFLKKQTI